jgi:prephenate dehydratase
MTAPMSEEVLDANSDDVLDAVERNAADIALGPAIALNTHTCSIKLRFDVLAKGDAEIYKQVAKVIAVIFRDTDLELQVSRSSIEAPQEEELVVA